MTPDLWDAMTRGDRVGLLWLGGTFGLIALLSLGEERDRKLPLWWWCIPHALWTGACLYLAARG